MLLSFYGFILSPICFSFFFLNMQDFHIATFVQAYDSILGLWFNSMADFNMEDISEDEHHVDVHEGLEENDESVSKSRNVPFITALNIVFLVSYFSLSPDERLSLEDIEEMETTTQEPV